MTPLTRRLPIMQMTAHASFKESIAYFGAARSGKSNALTRLALDLPGALFATSTRPGLATDTMTARSRKGPIYVADPAGDSGFGSNLICSPLIGCRNPRTAIDSAGELMQAAPKDPGGSGAWIDKQSTRLAPLPDARRRMVSRRDHARRRRLGHRPGCPPRSGGTPRTLPVRPARLGSETRRFHPHGHQRSRYTFNGAAAGVTTALEWLDDPAMEMIAGGPPGEQGEVRPGRVPPPLRNRVPDRYRLSPQPGQPVLRVAAVVRRSRPGNGSRTPCPANASTRHAA